MKGVHGKTSQGKHGFKGPSANLYVPQAYFALQVQSWVGCSPVSSSSLCICAAVWTGTWTADLQILWFGRPCCRGGERESIHNSISEQTLVKNHLALKSPRYGSPQISSSKSWAVQRRKAGPTAMPGVSAFLFLSLFSL